MKSFRLQTRRKNHRRLRKDDMQILREKCKEVYIKSEPESSPAESRYLRTMCRSLGNSFIEAQSDDTPNKMKIYIFNLLTPEPNPNPRA